MRSSDSSSGGLQVKWPAQSRWRRPQYWPDRTEGRVQPFLRNPTCGGLDRKETICGRKRWLSLDSLQSMYRVLAAADEVRERRDQARHPAFVKPELVATAPNQIWSWDITKLKG